MARLAAGDRNELEGVYRRLDAPVRAFCSRMLGHGPDADDATQEALVELFGKVSSFDPRRDAFAWALTIAAWECRTIRRQRTRARTAPLESEALASAAGGPAETFDERELITALEAAVGFLGETDRAVFDQVLDDVRGDATFRKRKERMLDRLRAFVRRTYDLDA